MEDKILKGKIITQQIEIFTKGMQVAYFLDGLFGYEGWIIGRLISEPRLMENGEILVIIDWGEYRGAHCQCSVFHLKKFMVEYEPIRDTSNEKPLYSKANALIEGYVKLKYERIGIADRLKVSHLYLSDSQWESVVKNNTVDTDTTIDFKIKEICTGKITWDFDMETKLIGTII